VARRSVDVLDHAAPRGPRVLTRTSRMASDLVVRRRSFSGYERANYGWEAGTDAREVAVSQQVVRNICLGERTLDQESPGSSPGGATGDATLASVAFLRFEGWGSVLPSEPELALMLW
jgi:hypothetical protein